MNIKIPPPIYKHPAETSFFIAMRTRLQTSSKRLKSSDVFFEKKGDVKEFLRKNAERILAFHAERKTFLTGKERRRFDGCDAELLKEKPRQRFLRNNASCKNVVLNKNATRSNLKNYGTRTDDRRSGIFDQL